MGKSLIGTPLVLALGMIMLLYSCKDYMPEAIETMKPIPLKISVSAEPLGMTRAGHEGKETEFYSGDQIGIYCVDEDGTVVLANALFEFNGTSWTTESSMEFKSQYSYYAYYPYTESPYTPDFTKTGIDDIFEDFITDEDDKFHYEDQSELLFLTLSDLMIAKATSPASGELAFAMQHKKALAILTGKGIKWSDFTGNIPYYDDTQLLYMMKPSTNTDFNYFGLTATVKAEGGHYIRYDLSKDSHMQYLTFVAQENGTFTFTLPASIGGSMMTSISYSLDGGETWTTTENSGVLITITTPTVAKGKTVLWKGIGKNIGVNTNNNCTRLSSTGKFSVHGNVMSLLYGDDFRRVTEFASDSDNNLKFLFKATKVTDASKLVLPATTLNDMCYAAMFEECTLLKKAPTVLPALQMRSQCYGWMFNGCTSLTDAPVIQARLLVSRCFEQMFKNCGNLSYIKAMFTTTPSNSYTKEWVSGVAASGTFVKNISASWDVNGVNGVPLGWYIEKTDI